MTEYLVKSNNSSNLFKFFAILFTSILKFDLIKSVIKNNKVDIQIVG